MDVLGWLRRHREVISLWLLAVLFACGCVLLGRWQLHRYQDKHAKAQLVTRNHAARTVPLRDLLPTPSTPLRPGDRYRAVTVQGTYDPQGTRLVRNRPHRGDDADASFGYEVVVPLVLPDGSAFLVDRGWVPNGRSGSTPGGRPDAVPDSPTGTVTVVARLRASEPRRGHDLPAGQVGSISVPEIASGTGHPTYQAYGALVSESPAPAQAPQALDPVRPDGGEGINASYAVQWVVFAMLGLGFPVWVIRRRKEAAAEGAAQVGGVSPAEEAPDDRAPDDRAPDDRAPDDRTHDDRAPVDEPLVDAVVVPVRQGRQRKRRHHVWDDEDE